MSDQALRNLDEVVAHSRRSFWMLLIMFLIFTTSALLLSISGTASTFGAAMLRLTPVFIAVFMGVAGSGMVGSKENKAAFKAIAADELRMQSLNGAYRVGFFAALIAQPVLAVLATSMGVVHPLGFMVAGTIGLSMLCFLGTFLWLDR
ncbi:MAG: hypothetical protein V4723_18990 [Pseudomonadota bacterium]